MSYGLVNDDKAFEKAEGRKFVICDCIYSLRESGSFIHNDPGRLTSLM
jgi:hypothetical protein